MNSGVACLWMIVRHYDGKFSEESFHKRSTFNTAEVTLLDLAREAERLGFRARSVKLSYALLTRDVPLPCIIPWGPKDFGVLLSKSGWGKKKKFTCAIPDKG